MDTLLHSADFHDVVVCLVAAMETRDAYTSGHSMRVAELTLRLGQRLGLNDDDLERVHMAAHMHDIGKIGLPDGLLDKPGALSVEERAWVLRHPQIGCDILMKSPALHGIARMVLHHHERWDGKGYPCGLAGRIIPLGARIIAVADSIDAMMSRRPYRQPLSEQQCRAELARCAGTQFDPNIVTATLALETLDI